MSWECVFAWIEHHPGLASWIQAVGSIAAIGGAVWISNNQHAKQKNSAIDDAVSRLDSIYAVVQGAVDGARIFIDFATKTDNQPLFEVAWQGVYSGSLTGALESLNVIPAHELGSYGLVGRFIAIKSCLAKICLAPVTGGQKLASVGDSIMLIELGNQLKLLNFSWAAFQKAYEDKKIQIAAKR